MSAPDRAEVGLDRIRQAASQRDSRTIGVRKVVASVAVRNTPDAARGLERIPQSAAGSDDRRPHDVEDVHPQQRTAGDDQPRIQA